MACLLSFLQDNNSLMFGNFRFLSTYKTIMNSYNSQTTGEEVAADCQSQIRGKTVLITGASPGGLGAKFASVIAVHGPACIILATRSLEKAKETAQDISSIAPNVRVHCVKLDLTSLEQVRTAAEEVNALEEKIDVIVNNAGIMAPPFSKTVDSIESQFATNYVGPFLFTNLLLQQSLAGDAPAKIRVVNITSNGYRLGPVRFEDWNFDVKAPKQELLVEDWKILTPR